MRQNEVLPMKFTNNRGMFSVLARAIGGNRYSKGDCDYTVTELIKPHALAVQQKAHENDLEEDVHDMFDAFMGDCVHAMLEKYTIDGELCEVRNKTTILGKTIGGKYDYFDTAAGHIVDYKTVTVASYKKGAAKKEWEQQLNMLAYIVRTSTTFPVNQLSVVAIYRDYRPGEYDRSDHDYPNRSEIISVPIWSTTDCIEYMEKRVSGRVAAEKGEYAMCNEYERWASPKVFAVMAKGKARTVRLQPSYEEACHHMKNKGGDYIVERPGFNMRCERYCPVSGRCKFMGTKE